MSEEFACIRQVARLFPYVSMDTEFPGVVAKPTGTFRNNSDYQCGRVHWLIPNLLFWPRIVMGSFGRYQCLKVNVDMLRVIQIGITFSDDDGNFPTDTPCTWQFHFSFSLQSDMCAPPPPKCQSSPLRPLRPRSYAEDSIQLLRTAGHPALQPLSTAHTNTATLVLFARIDFTYKTRFQY